MEGSPSSSAMGPEQMEAESRGPDPWGLGAFEAPGWRVPGEVGLLQISPADLACLSCRRQSPAGTWRSGSAVGARGGHASDSPPRFMCLFPPSYLHVLLLLLLTNTYWQPSLCQARAQYKAHPWPWRCSLPSQHQAASQGGPRSRRSQGQEEGGHWMPIRLWLTP